MEIDLSRLRPAVVRPAVFAIAFVCFFLPFVTVSCQGIDLATMSGYNLAVGFDIEDPATANNPRASAANVQRQSGDGLAVMAFLLTALGIGLGFVKNRIGFLGCICAGALAAFTLFRLKLKIDSSLFQQTGGLGKASYLFPFWLTLVLLIVAVGYNIYCLLGEMEFDTGRSSGSG